MILVIAAEKKKNVTITEIDSIIKYIYTEHYFTILLHLLNFGSNKCRQKHLKNLKLFQTFDQQCTCMWSVNIF